ncbi:MAG: DUF1573 domain-containing protein [Phycisphaeraceae bacterium]|nr:DUF1573 domain-containing protein [Phycisphaeraceae bacterium]
MRGFFGVACVLALLGVLADGTGLRGAEVWAAEQTGTSSSPAALPRLDVPQTAPAPGSIPAPGSVAGTAATRGGSLPAPESVASGLVWLEGTTFEHVAPPEELKIRHTFNFIVAGDEPVNILSMDTSCGCTTAKLDKRLWSPGVPRRPPASPGIPR